MAAIAILWFVFGLLQWHPALAQSGNFTVDD